MWAGGPAVLTLGLLAHTLVVSHPQQLQCEENFYRHTLPKHITHRKEGLERRCHGLAGRSFTSLYHPGCQNSIYMAFHLSESNGWGKGTVEGKDETLSYEDSHKLIPALYKNGNHAALSASLSPLQRVDILTAMLVESQVIPLCSKAGGDLYVQSGVGGLRECEAGVLWTAVCCAVPEGSDSFGMGIVLEGGGDLKTTNVADLEKLVGIEELFYEQCGQGGHAHQEEISLYRENLDIQDSNKEAETSRDTQMGTHSAEGTDLSGVTQEIESVIEESLKAESDSANDTVSDASESVLLYIMSMSFNVLCVPLSLVSSTLTNLPSQVTYVLQEDVAVLAELPQNSLVLARDLVGGVAYGVENVWSILYQAAETGVGSLYYFLSTLVGTLLLSCQEGVMGTGTLMSDTLGLTTRTLGQVWELGETLLGSAGFGLAEYLGTMGCEMGNQAWTVGGGLGTLVRRSVRGLVHMLNAMVAVIGGVLDNAVEDVQEAFGGVENKMENVVEAMAGK